jgi:tungstate transport system substrate-binding protein
MRLLRRSHLAVLLAVLASLATACGAGNDFIIGATTSTQDTGLLDVLTDAFREETGHDAVGVTPIVAGSGQILELARRGEVDVVITHSPKGEAQLLASGDAVDRRPFMHNFFLIVGPLDDPAKVGAAGSSGEALELIAEADARFISRGDQSGTHMRELAIWEGTGIDPVGESWYQESGAGQGQSLLLASDKGAYTMVDSGTFTVFQDRLDLQPYFVDELPNQYSVMRVNSEKHEVNETVALAFAEFLASPAAQRIIAEFGREEYGESLFIPTNSPSGTGVNGTPMP